MLKLDRQGAENVIRNVKQQIDEMENVARQIDNLIKVQLPNYWEGDSATAAQNTYDSDYKNFLQRKVPDMVEELKNYMETCVKKIAETDSQLSGR